MGTGEGTPEETIQGCMTAFLVLIFYQIQSGSVNFKALTCCSGTADSEDLAKGGQLPASC